MEFCFLFVSRENLRIFPTYFFTRRSATADQAVFLHDPTCESGVQKRPQAFLNPEIKNNSSAEYAQSSAARISNRYSTINSVPAVMRAQPMRLLAVKGSCSTTKASARVMTTLSLSMGTTLDAAPTCNAW